MRWFLEQASVHAGGALLVAAAVVIAAVPLILRRQREMGLARAVW